jgi:hypothetical protein
VELGSRVGNWEALHNYGRVVEEPNNRGNIKLLLAPDEKGRNGCHFAAERGVRETLQKLWECAKWNINQRR